ncbi:hypothetical protein A5810_001114 [Enterococcus faecium]|uniref:Uncharacterized protein n=1 Tax=Enterococcus faecium TaxID=1352 RepID=A0A242BHM3_ENTFC|nr:hypothetical protein [Enterococcus faecium]OTN94868.1 hypothetical protein A5810_001114 [Enterococcus faecium]
MKKVKKLLTSTLSLGLVLGNMGGTVVEATSALHSIELPALRQLRPQEEKEQEETNEEENKPRASTLPRLPIETQEKEELRMENVLQESRLARMSAAEIEEEVRKAVTRRMEYIISETIKAHDHTFQVGERIIVTDVHRVGWNYTTGPVVGPAVPSHEIPGETIDFFFDYDTAEVHTGFGNTESGNWSLIIRGASGAGRHLYVELVRRANNPVSGK